MSRLATRLAGALLLALVASACAGSEPGTTSPSSEPERTNTKSPAPTGLERLATPVDAVGDVLGVVEVDGRDLAVRCSGSGRPTVVVLHGWIDEPGVSSLDYYGALRGEVTPDLRLCAYDRVNVGHSESVPGTQTPEMVVADLDGLMEALGEPGPFVLVGQSAGGMVASAYAVAHPDKVAGVVMVDASFDEEITIEDRGMVPAGISPCDPENRAYDGRESLQKIDNCAMYRWAYERRDRRPEVPLVYMAARRAPWSDFKEFGPRWTQAIVPLQKEYAASWSPGRFQWVDSGHDIHVEKPAAVADAIRWVVKNRG